MGRSPAWGEYVLVETTIAGQSAKVSWADEYGRTEPERLAYINEKNFFPTNAGFSEMKFTKAFLGQDKLRNDEKKQITHLKSEVKRLECESKQYETKSLERFHDAEIGNIVTTLESDVIRSIVANPKYADLTDVDRAKLYVEAADRVLLNAKNFKSEAEKRMRSDSITHLTATFKNKQDTLKIHDGKIGEVYDQFKDYKEFLTGDGDQEFNPYFWRDFKSELDHGVKPPSARKLERTAAIQNPQHKYEESDEEPSRNKQKVLPSLPECTGKIHAFLKKATAKETFDKIQKFFNTSETTHEMCTLSVVDSRMRGLGLTEEELEVINKLVKECMIGGEVNYVMFTNRMGQSLDPGAYTPDDMWETQPFV
jgi:hypothetical protein